MEKTKLQEQIEEIQSKRIRITYEDQLRIADECFKKFGACIVPTKKRLYIGSEIGTGELDNGLSYAYEDLEKLRETLDEKYSSLEEIREDMSEKDKESLRLYVLYFKQSLLLAKDILHRRPHKNEHIIRIKQIKRYMEEGTYKYDDYDYEYLNGLHSKASEKIDEVHQGFIPTEKEDIRKLTDLDEIEHLLHDMDVITNRNSKYHGVRIDEKGKTIFPYELGLFEQAAEYAYDLKSSLIRIKYDPEFEFDLEEHFLRYYSNHMRLYIVFVNELLKEKKPTIIERITSKVFIKK